jgi:hypothetical protein
MSGEQTTRRSKRARPPAAAGSANESPAAAEHTDLTTVPARRALQKQAHAALGQAPDGTAQMDSPSATTDTRPASLDLGVVAPPDPDVPPLPPTKEGPRPGAAVPVGTDDTATTRPLAMEELSMGEGEAVSVPHPGLGAMPAPRFPSLPSLDGDLRSSDFGAEAQRLGVAAQRRGEEARRSADLAQAAQRAAAMAQEAALLAARGRTSEAIGVLREAQTLDEAVARGDVPVAALVPEPAVSAVQGLLQSFGLRPRPDRNLMASRQAATLVVVVAAVILLLLALVLALLL